MIRLENLRFSYWIKGKELPVFQSLNAEFETGSITAIVGRSGCGKTSLLRILAGLSAPSGGRLAFDSKNGSDRPARRSIIFQDFGLLPWATVRQNAELGLKIQGISRAERRDRVDPILLELGLENFSPFFPGRLSGGMRQRVAIARALASESDILLLDEPFSSLDALSRENLQDSLLEAQARHGTTIILVTHSIEEAAYLADRIYIMEGKNPSTLSKPFATSKKMPRQPAPRAESPKPEESYRDSESYHSDIKILRERFFSVIPNSVNPNDVTPGKQPMLQNWSAAVKHAKPFLGRLGKLCLAVAVVFALWEVLSLALDAPFLPRPGIALEKFFSGFQDGILSRHAGASLLRILASLALAGPPAWAAGLLAGRIALADALASPLVYLFHPLPKVAFLPLLMLIFGLGDASKIALMGLVIFGQLFVGARDSAKAITPSLIDTVKSLGGGKGATLRHAILPATLPALISSLRISLGTAIAVLFLSETFASINGLGWYIMDSWSRVDYPDMYASIMALSALGLGLYIALDAAQAILLRWRET
jgi:ABC-type nitrate/sulfonate/bicarbonate transport system ATPase subunit/ABC-type nitrate/sulfonate/bicarbonate transport system permease component